MKVKTLAMMAGLGGSLFLVGQADAAYDGITAEIFNTVNIGGTDYNVWRVYVNTTSATDSVEAISGNAANPIIVNSFTGNFYQNKDAGANNIEPNPAFIPVFPNLEWDTFVTIGRAQLDGAVGPTMTQGVFPPDGPGFMADTLMVSNGAWFRTPGNAATVAGDDLRVLIMQLTIPVGNAAGSLDGEGIVRVAGNFDGESTQFIGQTFQLPAPGALALLGLAGLAGGRRRRRA